MNNLYDFSSLYYPKSCKVKPPEGENLSKTESFQVPSKLGLSTYKIGLLKANLHSFWS